MINKLLTDLIGPNWRTTIYGFTSKAILGFILAAVVQPHMIDDALGQHAQAVKSWCVLIWFILGTAKDSATADKANVPAIANAVVDAEVKPSAQVNPPPRGPSIVPLILVAFLFLGCATQRAQFGVWFHNPKTQATLKAVASVAEQIGLNYAKSQGVIDQADADNIAGVISAARQLEATPKAGSPAAIKQVVQENAKGVDSQALADAFARGVAIAQSKAPGAPATVILEAVASAFPVGVNKAVAINEANP